MSNLEDPLYKNWVRSALGLKYLKEGIYGFVDQIAKQHHKDLLHSYIKSTGSAATSCSECTSENLLPDHPTRRCIQKFRSKCFCNNPVGRRKCPNNFCSRFYDLIILAHDERNPIWANTDPARWYSDHWALAQCFLGTTGYSDKQQAVETDASGLLSIMLNNIEIRNHLGSPDNVIKARDIRNEIMHAIAFEVDGGKLNHYIDQMILVLQDAKVLIHAGAAQSAIARLIKLKRDQIYISLEDAFEMRTEALRAINDGIKDIESKKDEAIQDIASKEKQVQEDIDAYFDSRLGEHSKTTNDEVMVIQEGLTDIKNKKNDVIQSIETKGKQIHVDIDAHFDKRMREKDKNLEDKSLQTVVGDNTENDTKELTIEELDLQKHLIDLYLQGYTKVDISPLSTELEEDVEEVYVPLKAERVKPDPYRSIFQLKGLFHSGKNQINHIYLTGDAGIGKTTFCRKLISTWCRAKTKYMHKGTVFNISAVFDDGDKNDDVYEMLQDLSYYDIYGESDDSANENPEDGDQRGYDIYGETDDSDNENSEDGDQSVNTTDQIALENFDFLFFVSLRDTHQERSIEEMIKNQLIQQECHMNCFSKVIERKPEKCLVILDGLDEWQPPSPLPTHPTVPKGLPLSSTAGSYVKITTSRPWKTDIVRPKFREHDSEVKLIGIGEKGSRLLIEKVILKLSKSSTTGQPMDFENEVIKKNIKELKFVPLLVKLLLCLWCENGALEESRTDIYSSVVNLMFLHAEEKYSENKQFQSIKSSVDTSACELPFVLGKFPHIYFYRKLFQSLSKFAFNMLFGETSGSSLVFQLTDLTQFGLTDEEANICLNVGILSQKSEFRKSIIRKSRSLSFIHQTFQEYFAAIHILMTYTDINVIHDICGFCDTTEKLHKMSSTLTFLGDMNQDALYIILANITKLGQFEFEVINHKLILKSQRINMDMMEVFMRANFYSIVLLNTDFGTNALRLPNQMNNLKLLELNSVKMTHKGLKALLESMQITTNSIILEIAYLTWNEDDDEVISTVPVELRNLQKVYITGTDLRQIILKFGNGNQSLESVELYKNILTEIHLCSLINTMQSTGRGCELIVESTHIIPYYFVLSHASCILVSDQITNLCVLELNEITITHEGLKHIVENIPKSKHGVELKIKHISWDSFNDSEDRPIIAEMQNIKKIHISLTDLSNLELRLGNGNENLESIVLCDNTMTNNAFCILVNDIASAGCHSELTDDNTKLQESALESYLLICQNNRIIRQEYSDKCPTVLRKCIIKRTGSEVLKLIINNTDLSNVGSNFLKLRKSFEFLELSNVIICRNLMNTLLRPFDERKFEQLRSKNRTIRDTYYFDIYSEMMAELNGYVDGLLECSENVVLKNVKIV